MKKRYSTKHNLLYARMLEGEPYPREPRTDKERQEARIRLTAMASIFAETTMYYHI